MATQHADLTEEACSRYTQDRRILTIAAEMYRARKRLQIGDLAEVRRGYERVLNLTDLTAAVSTARGFRRELLRWRASTSSGLCVRIATLQPAYLHDHWWIMTPYRSRAIAPALNAALKSMPVVVLTGMRQTGKSTLLANEPVLAARRSLSLDDYAQLDAARSDPAGFVSGTEPLTIDEVQRCPDLLVAIKRSVDKDRRPGRFLISGSANLLLLKGVSESLAGRAVYFTLHPFTRREVDGHLVRDLELRHLFDTGEWRRGGSYDPILPEDILKGGLPSVVLGEVDDPHHWYTGFEQTYLERDLRQLAQVADLIEFRRLLQLAALRTGQILNRSELARDSHVSTTTASRYLSLLEASFVIHLLPPHLASRASRLIKSPKLIFADTGLACHLAGVRDLSERSAEPLRGPLFETYAAQNLSGMLGGRWPEARLAFWHIQGRREVDLVLEVGRDTLAIEIKAAGRWTRRDVSALEAFLESSPHCRAAVLAYNGTETVRLGERLWAAPLSRVLS